LLVAKRCDSRVVVIELASSAVATSAESRKSLTDAAGLAAIADQARTGVVTV